MIQMRDWEIKLKQIVPWLFIVGIMYAMTLMKLPLIVTNIFFVLSTLACMVKLWKDAGENRIEVILIMLGVLIRIIVCLIDIYGSAIVTIPFSGDDSLNFYNTSVEYYYGDMSRVYTNYPYVLYAIYQIAGLNRFAAQYINILCWGFCVLLLQKSCRLLEIESKLRIAAVAMFSFLPFNICISSILMRDMIVALSITFTSYCVLKWMSDGKYRNFFLGVLATVPVLLLHNCVLAMLGVMGLVAALYSPQKRKFCIEKKCIYILLGIFAVSLVLLFNQGLRRFFFSQIPIFGVKILDMINAHLFALFSYSGGSTYLMNEYVSNYAELFFGTFERIGYFLFSPVPSLWRGAKDILSFLASSSVYLICILTMIVGVFYKRRDSYRTVLFLVFFFVSCIFAWGVTNAGTAMRHREKILGILILLTIYSVQLIKNARRKGN